MSDDIYNLKTSNRPLSPHLSIYKMQISSVLSVGHRLSGIAMFGALCLLCWWFNLWVFSKFDPAFLRWFDCIWVKMLLIFTSYGYFYHLCTGIRHLIWDAGYGFSIKEVSYTGWCAVASSVLLTLAYWVFI